MKKIFFDANGCIGTMQGSNLLPVKSNERMVCTQQEAEALGLSEFQWITLDELRALPNANAQTAYDIFTRTANS